MNTLPLKVDGKALRAPRRTPPRGTQRPSWGDYRVKVPKRCDHCCQLALESLRDGEPFEGIRDARRTRRQGGQTLLLCHEHARLQREQDDIDYPDKRSAGGGGTRVLS